MVEALKRLVRKNETTLAYARKGRWIGELFWRNLLNPAKIMLFLKVMPYTMVGYKRLSNAYELSGKAEAENVLGAFVEFGVWKGGAAGVMAAAALRHAQDKQTQPRMTWLFDSFEGLPEPTEKDGAYAAEYALEHTSGRLRSIEKCVGPIEDVEKLFFSVLRIEREHVRIEKGWFQETLPGAKQELSQIAILRIDADWYESTAYVLEELYGQVTPGGWVIVDDYGHWEGCKKAVDEFFERRGINPQLIPIDETGVYFQKQR